MPDKAATPPEEATPAAVRRRVAGRRGGPKKGGNKGKAEFNPVALGRKSRCVCLASVCVLSHVEWGGGGGGAWL